MYHVYRREHRHTKARRNGVIALVLLLIALIIYAIYTLSVTPRQDIRNAPPLSKQYNAAGNKKITIDKPLFTLELPQGWVEIPEGKTAAAPTYSFRAPQGQSQYFDMYIDTIPATMALNRAIVVSPQGSGVSYDRVSENCTTFTDSAQKNPSTGYAPARWQGADFICDMGNFARALVGTVSTEGINRVTVTGSANGPHQLFIAFTDNNINPNYTTLYDLLASLNFK